MRRVVLVTGVSGQIGSLTARRLADDPGVDRVIGLDVLAPRGDLGPVRFVRADIRNSVIARILADEAVDTVVHLNVRATTRRPGGRVAMKETNVIGTMQLLAACQRASGVRRLVVKSSTTVYGASPRDPAVFTEETAPKRNPRSGYAKDCFEVEGYVRGFSRRRPDVAVTTLRCANVLGRGIDTPLGQYLRLPVLPTVLGFNPRLQLLHVDDALAALHRATVEDVPGTFNVAGSGVLTLSQVALRLGKIPVGVPRLATGAVAHSLRAATKVDLNSEQAAFLTYGRVVDISALRQRFGYTPRYSTAETLDSFAAEIGRGPITADRVRWLEEAVAARLDVRGSHG
jgi:UDP-glucose 4-epimerase